MDGQAKTDPAAPGEKTQTKPTEAQRRWLSAGLDQAGGKLPLFDGDGKQIPRRTVESCLRQGWAEPWFENPIKPDWLVCKLTEKGRKIVAFR